MKHTKGKWEVQLDGNWTIVVDDFTICHDNIDDHEKRPEESFANANLIAASPELLEACKAIGDAMLKTQGFMPNFLEQAIAKAEGK